METNSKHFENYGQASAAALRAMEVKVSTADLRRKEYEPEWIYLNRIGKKVRILSAKDAIRNGGTIRNAIKITWNPDAYAKDHMIRYISARLALIVRHAQHGTCQVAIRCSDIREVLAGACEGTALWNKGAAILYTNTETWAAMQAAKIQD